MRALSRPWLTTAALVLSLTLHLSDGFYHEPTLAWLALALLSATLGVAGVTWPWDRDSDAGEAITRGLLKVGVLVSALAMVTRPLARYMADPRPWAHPELLLTVAAAAVIALGAVAADSATGRRRAAIALAAVTLDWFGFAFSAFGFLPAVLALALLLVREYDARIFPPVWGLLALLPVLPGLVALVRSLGDSRER